MLISNFDLRSSLLTLGIADASIALLSLNRSLQCSMFNVQCSMFNGLIRVVVVYLVQGEFFLINSTPGIDDVGQHKGDEQGNPEHGA